MKVAQAEWKNGSWSSPLEVPAFDVQLVLIFGGRDALESGEALAEIRTAFPATLVIGCSSAGEIMAERVSDGTVNVTAIGFESTRVSGECVEIDAGGDALEVGQRLAERLYAPDLRHVFVLSDGLNVNGSALAAGLTSKLSKSVSVTGGLSADGARFEKTLVIWNGEARSNAVVAVGLYGTSLGVGYGSLGGWDPFGPERIITRSSGNVLYELDHQPALALYRKYLGSQADGLPASGLLFPLSLRRTQADEPVVRTILGVNEQDQSLRFAGDTPEGSYARLMKANFNRLIEGAVGAARTSCAGLSGESPGLALLISCVGRKLVLKQRVEEEVEGVREIVGERAALAGFYSYGEISPFTPTQKCELHNQTMTITTFWESAA